MRMIRVTIVGSAMALAFCAAQSGIDLPRFKIERALAAPHMRTAQIGPLAGMGPLPLFAAAAATIGTPTSIGAVNGGTNNTSSITIPTSANIVAGNLVVAFFQVASGVTVSSVSDGTNSYSHANSCNESSGGAGNPDTEIWYVSNASAAPSGASLTATLSGTSTGSNGYLGQAFQVSGIAASGALDKTPTCVTTNSTTPSISTGTLSQANEIGFGTSTTFYNSNAYTEASGFTNLFNNHGTYFYTGIGYKIVAATSSVSYSPTWANSANSWMLTQAVTFK